MTPLVAALRALGLEGEVDLAGRWVKVQGERCAVYVVAAVAGGYYTWCDDPLARSVRSFRDPSAAIHAGLRRATNRQEEDATDG